MNESSRITGFLEKPSQPQSAPGKPGEAMASMGVYVFSCELLVDVLGIDHANPNSSHDFGKDILPSLIQTDKVMAYEFGGNQGRVTADRYWRDVGTIDAYFESNMDLLKPVPPIDLYQRNWGIRTADAQCPPARTCSGACGAEPKLTNSIISPGAIVSGGIVTNSILSPNVRVDAGACVTDSILMEGVTVGMGSHLSRCIVDKHVQIPPATIIDAEFVASHPECVLSEKGVVVIPKRFANWNPVALDSSTRDDTRQPSLSSSPI